MAGGSQNHNVICNQYLCDFYILESGIFILRLSLESVLEISREGRERSETAAVDLLPGVSVLYEFVQVNLGGCSSRLSYLGCRPHRRAVVGLHPASLRNLTLLSCSG